MWWAWAPVRRQIQVRNAGVECNCSDLLGASWLYSFTWENARLYNGKKVRVCFDPASDPCRAAIVLLENSPGTFEKAGTVLTTTAEATSSVPAIVRDGPLPRIDWDGGAIERTRQMRAIQRASRQWIFRAFAPDGRTVHTAEAELRGPSGEITATAHAERTPAEPVSSVRIQTDADLEADLVRTIARERRAAERGLMPLVPA
jgi:hypothetical protein